jgi:predicted transcriptional regulator
MSEPKPHLVNPIDPDKITETPSTLPYAHHVGSALIRPDDLKGLRSKALSSMEEQTEMQLDQIREQIDLLAKQAQKLVQRRQASFDVYRAKIGFEPLIGKTYYLYERKDGSTLLSMISPDSWRKMPFEQFLNAVKLLADHTWEVVEQKA